MLWKNNFHVWKIWCYGAQGRIFHGVEKCFHSVEKFYGATGLQGVGGVAGGVGCRGRCAVEEGRPVRIGRERLRDA